MKTNLLVMNDNDNKKSYCIAFETADASETLIYDYNTYAKVNNTYCAITHKKNLKQNKKNITHRLRFGT